MKLWLLIMLAGALIVAQPVSTNSRRDSPRPCSLAADRVLAIRRSLGELRAQSFERLTPEERTALTKLRAELGDLVDGLVAESIRR